MVRNLEFDVCEMAFTTYLCAKAHGKPLSALPIFLVRGFHHGAMAYNTRSDIVRRETSRAGQSASIAATPSHRCVGARHPAG